MSDDENKKPPTLDTNVNKTSETIPDKKNDTNLTTETILSEQNKEKFTDNNLPLETIDKLPALVIIVC